MHSPKRRGRPAGPAKLWQVLEVAEQLSVPLQTVYSWTRQLCWDGRPVLPKVKLGRLVRIRQSDLERLPERLAARRPFSFFSRKHV